MADGGRWYGGEAAGSSSSRRPGPSREKAEASISLCAALRRLQLGAPGGDAARGHDARTIFARQVYGQVDFLKRLDLVQELEGGHTGCVNTLSWSSDGRFLLSGSDDTLLCFWSKDSAGDGARRTGAGMALDGVIDTGHRANIFCARFAGESSHGGGVGNDRVISCAGDHEIRVFDVERSAALPKLRKRRVSPLTHGLTASGSMPSQVIRCHKDRVKRLAIDPASPHVFLSCSEDATVRSHDLRHPHRCGPSQRQSCPAPLVSYASSALDIYTLSVSRMQPYLFAIAGRDPYVYLHDRRMPALIARQWHHAHPRSSRAVPSTSGCVRRFAPSAPLQSSEKARQEAHVTAVKIGESSGREMLASYSGDGIYLFDLYADPAGPLDQSGDTFSNGRKSRRKDAGRSEDGLSSAGQAAPTTETSLAQSDASQVRLEIGPEVNDDIFVDDASTENGDSRAEGTIQHADGNQPTIDSLETTREASASDAERGVQLTFTVEPDGAGAARRDIEGDGDDDNEDRSDVEEEEDEPSLRGWAPKTKTRTAEPDVPVVSSYLSKYTGHANVQTVKDCNFFGPDDSYIVSGSDDGNLFIWDKKTSKVINVLEGDSQVVNVIQGHPFEPQIAVSGIDSSVKIFEPVALAASFRSPSSPSHSISPSPAPGASRQRLDQLDAIVQRNVQSNRNEGQTQGISSRLLLGLLNRRMRMQRAAGGGQTGDADESQEQIVISLQDLMQEAQDQDEDGQCATQ